MTHLEANYTKRVCMALEGCNAVVIPYVASMRNRPNVPDRIVWHKYWHGMIEFKGINTVVRPGQLQMLKMLNARVPGSAWIVRAVDATSLDGIIQDWRGVECARFSGVVEMLKDLRELQRALTERGFQ